MGHSAFCELIKVPCIALSQQVATVPLFPCRPNTVPCNTHMNPHPHKQFRSVAGYSRKMDAREIRYHFATVIKA